MAPYVIETKVHIEASPEAVMAKIVDIEHVPEWSTFIREMRIVSDHTSVEEGCRLSVRVDPKGNGKTSGFQCQVLKKSPKEFRWRGSLPIPGLVTGEHYFIADKDESGSGTILTHGELFGGILVPIFKALMASDTVAGFERHNADLKKVCEEKSS